MPHVEQLLTCVQRGDLQSLIDLLYTKSADINACDETGQSVLHYACFLGQVDIVIHLLNCPDCNILCKDSLYGHSPLHAACLYDQQRVATELLKRLSANPADINTQDNFGWTALHHAARNGNLNICCLLLNYEAKANITNKCGKTALHYAAEHGHLAVVRFLYDYVRWDVTPLPLCKSPLPSPTLLHCAALRGQTAVSEWLRMQAYPPNARCIRVLDTGDRLYREELAEEVASARGHVGLKAALAAYRATYEAWVDDIHSNSVTLERLKLSVCGHPLAGKSAMCESLTGSANYPEVHGLEADARDGPGRHTAGIDISSVQLSGKESFSLWDFAGQVDSFVTHQYFISTESTVFAVLVDLRKSEPEQRAELASWLGFIKLRNLGQVAFIPSQTELGGVPMLCSNDRVVRQLQSKPLRRSTVRESLTSTSEKNTKAEEDEEEGMYGSVLQPVPVIIIGSHYDQIPVDTRDKVIREAQSLVSQMCDRYEEFLDIENHLFPLDCTKRTSPEMAIVKEQLCCIRSRLIKLQPRYPRVVELVARRLEMLREEKPNLKVLPWAQLCSLVQEDVNRLLTEQQLSYICKCLANAGVIVYNEEGALANYVFIDPVWLCRDVLGKALAPAHFPSARLSPIGAHQISEDVLLSRFSAHFDQQHFPVILQLLQHFDLCHRLPEPGGLLEFPCFISAPLDPRRWRPDPSFVAYLGRRFVCDDDTDVFPPGFFCRLQVQALRTLRQARVVLFRGSFVVDAGWYQSLVRINEHSTAVDIVGRTGYASETACYHLMDHVQTLLAELIRAACPTVFLVMRILSCSDLLHFRDPPHVYPFHEVVGAIASGTVLTNGATHKKESPLDLLYGGDEELQRRQGGKHTRIMHLSPEIIRQVEELLSDGEKDWRDLARKIHLEKYIQLLESRAPYSSRLLLLKWGEKPRWTVESLMYALKEIQRMDVYNFLRARTMNA